MICIGVYDLFVRPFSPIHIGSLLSLIQFSIYQGLQINNMSYVSIQRYITKYIYSRLIRVKAVEKYFYKVQNSEFKSTANIYNAFKSVWCCIEWDEKRSCENFNQSICFVPSQRPTPFLSCLIITGEKVTWGGASM